MEGMALDATLNATLNATQDATQDATPDATPDVPSDRPRPRTEPTHGTPPERPGEIPMDASSRKDLIARYRAGFDQVTKALEGFPAEELTAHPIPGKWSAAEIVHHLADSEMNSAIRIRKLLAEAHPVIQGYDQEVWAARLHYQARPIEPSLQAFRYARARARRSCTST